MAPVLAERVEELRADREHGASWMARRAVEALTVVADEPAPSGEALLEKLIVAGTQLADSRPGVGSVAGAVGRVLADIGLVNRRCNDYFQGRLLFPIRDVQGRVIAFGGRALGMEEPKYLNSPETPLYVKGRNLYALDVARGAIREKNRAVIVEGYLDCLMAHQHGFGETVAALGTAFTESQLALLRRYSDEVVALFDHAAEGALVPRVRSVSAGLGSRDVGPGDLAAVFDWLSDHRAPAEQRYATLGIRHPLALEARLLDLRQNQVHGFQLSHAKRTPAAAEKADHEAASSQQISR